MFLIFSRIIFALVKCRCMCSIVGLGKQTIFKRLNETLENFSFSARVKFLSWRSRESRVQCTFWCVHSDKNVIACFKIFIKVNRWCALELCVCASHV